MVVEAGSQEVVRRRDRMGIPRQMQIDVIKRGHTRAPSAGRAAFDAEHGTQRRLSQRDDRAAAKPVQPHREPDRGDRLPLTQRCRIDRGHENIPA